jgi:hypothetical protein
MQISKMINTYKKRNVCPQTDDSHVDFTSIFLPLSPNRHGRLNEPFSVTGLL